MTDRQERWVIAGLALVSIAVQLALMGLLMLDPAEAARVPQAQFGVWVSLGLLVLSHWPGLPLRALHLALVGVLAGWFVALVGNVFVTHRAVTSGLLLHLTLVALFSFSWLPVRPAVALVSVMYLSLLVGSRASVHQDLPGQVLMGFVLLLIWYLTVHGRTVRTEQIRNAQLTALAFTDPLTGLLNRRSGAHRLDALQEQWRAQPQRLVVAMFDLDHFKAVNDLHGHQRGDELLLMVAGVLREATGTGDAVVRWGGEEFLVALSGRTAEEAVLVTERILATVRAARLPGLPPVTMSAGLALLSEVNSVTEVIDLADRRLYEAKAAGRDRTVSADLVQR